MTTRALVLGAGGVTGVGWATGLAAGLAEDGIDLAAADLIVGTSAGSVVGAQLATGADLEERYAAQLLPSAATAGPAPRLSRRALLTFGWALLRSRRDPRAFRTRIGRLALTAPAPPEQERIDVIAARLPVHEWPERPRLLVTAVDAETGELTAFERADGVPLVHAVAASCAVPGVWPPVTIAGRRWIDGGIAAPVNGHLAAGHDRVVVIAPITVGAGPMPSVATQVAELSRTARVVVVAPDAASRQAIGRNTLDPARRAGAARAGRAQAATAASAVRAVWD